MDAADVQGNGRRAEGPADNMQDDSVGGHRGRRSRGSRRNGSRGSLPRGSKFKGKCDDLANHVCDAGPPGGNQDLFANTTREIAECVAREHANAGEFRLGMTDMALPVLQPPTPPADTNAGLAEIEMCKLDLKDHHEKVKHRAANMQKIFSLVLGQCSRTIRDRLEADANWNTINTGSDIMALLALIRQCMCTQATARHATHSLIDAQVALCKFRQGEKMTNSEHLECLKSPV